MNSISVKNALSAVAIMLLLTGCVMVPANYQYQRSSAVYQAYYYGGGYYRYYDPIINFTFRIGGGYQGYHRLW